MRWQSCNCVKPQELRDLHSIAAMVLGRLSLGLGLFASVAAAPRIAEACEPPLPGVFPEVPEAIEGVPTDGVIAFRASVYGTLEEQLATLTIDVVLEGDVAVAGAIETVELSSSGDQSELIVVWRPESALAPSTAYQATITVQNPDGLEPSVFPLAVTTGAGPVGTWPTPALDAVTLDKLAAGSGERVCCDESVPGDCGTGIECQALQFADQPQLTATLHVPADPLGSQSYVRVSAGVDDATEVYASLGLANAVDGAGLVRAFEMAAGDYCLAVELVSLVDGSVGAPVMSCLEHGTLELDEGVNPDFDPFIAQCMGALYWEDTGEPYEPGDGGETSGSTSGADAGTTDDDGGVDEGTDAGDGSTLDGGDVDGTGGQNDSDKGCACDAQGGGSLGTGLLALALGLGARRRRR
jgi:MYXO-CTERM domain-containing protein